jgi:thiosulfate/3-mercaptopyruvate sulfurtransferase
VLIFNIGGIKMKKTLSLIVSLVMILSLFTTGCSQKPAEQPQEQPKQEQQVSEPTYANPDLLVDADWLKANLNNVVVLDARDEKQYNAKHVAGAIHVAWQPFTDMEGKNPGDKGWGTLLEPSKLADVIGKLGIDGTKPVVIYNGAPEKTWGEDGRVAWTLKMAGIKDIKILNGGWSAWEAKGYESDANVPTPTPVNFKIASMAESLNVTTDYINSNLDKIKIIDAREVDEYNGATKFGEKRGGHLPGAINITWTQVYNADGTIKSQKDLEALFSSKGINKDDEIATYCTKGIRSGHLALILKMAGYDKAKNYDASFYEWAGNESLKLEK